MNKRVLLVFGGESTEHEISIKSATNVSAALDTAKYDITRCYIDRDGRCWLTDRVSDDQDNSEELMPVLGQRKFLTSKTKREIVVDVIFPVLHGKNGEDGTVQGMADLLHIPIVGCDNTASAVCMDKVLTKQILEANGIRTVEHIVHRQGNQLPDYKDVSETLGRILFVKPARSGSSVGVSKVHDKSEFLPAIKGALEHDDRVLIERAVSGRELETAVLGNPPEHLVSGIGEIISGAEFYDYDDKYSPNSTSQVVSHADLDPEIEQKIRGISHKAFEVLGCTGMARIDYMLEDDVPHVIEVNALPGFTNISMYPKLWQEAGLSSKELIDKLITLAVQ